MISTKTNASNALPHEMVPLMVQFRTVAPAVIDVDNMVKDLKTRAVQNVANLELTISALQPELDASRAKFRADRRAIRVSYKQCRKKITWNKKKWKTTSECHPFAAHLSGSGLKSACKKKPKCVLRQAKSKAKLTAKHVYKTTRLKFRDHKKQLRKAKFEKNILPKIIMLLKPALLKGLQDFDMSDGDSGALRSCALSSADAACVPLDQIGSAVDAVALLRNYMTVSLNAVLSPTLTVVIDKILDKIWKLVGKVVDSIKSSIQTAVGTIPVVGGALAVVVGLLIQTIYDYTIWGVETAIDGVRVKLQELLVTNIVDNVFATGHFTDEELKDPSKMVTLASQMTTAANATQKEVVHQAQGSITAAAAAAEFQAAMDASGAQASIVTEGETVKQGEEEDAQADEDAEAAEDALDIDDEDNE
jgi:hypothetical protein